MTKMIPIEYNPAEFYKTLKDSKKMSKSELRRLRI